mmetsp:Transcript_861/g.507  ORF Transcript_861/g.507 Transcript_861/m.507 type:complete len:86 (-) Transcript_861:121-378(-)|eukprot:CAMPEP_0202971182 /NCGR_PEP_ID=MMETSP1396-20130829/24815_1 /ASSEMBLY_ACC=CAM_ASM_000872 /TAXON_ID= /ORGANISM="Pseudokeronopsis sp., Strain Brazil" /LENGTH=85 /DNA_ID=CAMNT_0049700311 /DNA_START=75 /DNA_END=332 /DNA_ORIENTATION=+
MNELKERLDRLTKATKEKKLLNDPGSIEDVLEASTKSSGPFPPIEPVIIGSSVGLGTARVRANHIEAFVDYYEEQERLKKENAPI